MAEAFDPYYSWLGIPPAEQPLSGETCQAACEPSLTPTSKACLKGWNVAEKSAAVGSSESLHSVCWAAHESGGLKSLWRSDEERHIRKWR